MPAPVRSSRRCWNADLNCGRWLGSLLPRNSTNHRLHLLIWQSCRQHVRWTWYDTTHFALQWTVWERHKWFLDIKACKHFVVDTWNKVYDPENEHNMGPLNRISCCSMRLASKRILLVFLIVKLILKPPTKSNVITIALNPTQSEINQGILLMLIMLVNSHFLFPLQLNLHCYFEHITTKKAIIKGTCWEAFLDN